MARSPDQFDRWLADLRAGRLTLTDVERALQGGLLAKINAIQALGRYVAGQEELVRRLLEVATAPENWQWSDFVGCPALWAVVEVVRTGDPRAIEAARQIVARRPSSEQRDIGRRLQEEGLPELL
jgi:hypothetical protein